VGAELQRLWVSSHATTTVYAIQPGRGFDDGAALLGAAFAGVLVRDGWAPYRRFEQAAHQTCLQHLLTRSRELQTDRPRAVLPGRVRPVLQQVLTLRDRCVAGTVPDHGLAVARGQLETRSSTILGQRSTLPAVRRFAPSRPRMGRALRLPAQPCHRRHDLARRTSPPARGRES
jgi:hypothetical protein